MAVQYTENPIGHTPRTQHGADITKLLQQYGVANLDLRNTVELILAVVTLHKELSK